MNGTHVEELHPVQRVERSLRAFAGGGSFGEALGGIAVAVLAIIGLAGGLRQDMMAIATIVLGASLVLEGGAIAASFRKALWALEGESSGSQELGGSASFEVLAGFTGIVLGILALIGVGAVNYLVSVSVIVFGCALLLGSTATARLHAFTSHYMKEGSRYIARASSETGAGGQMLIGLGAIVLGILALLGINTVILNLVALLALGASVLLSGSSLGASTVMQPKSTPTT